MYHVRIIFITICNNNNTASYRRAIEYVVTSIGTLAAAVCPPIQIGYPHYRVIIIGGFFFYFIFKLFFFLSLLHFDFVVASEFD